MTEPKLTPQVDSGPELTLPYKQIMLQKKKGELFRNHFQSSFEQMSMFGNM